MASKPEDVTFWLSDDEYAKAVGQLRLNIGAVLSKTFDIYGLGSFVPGATNAIIKLAEDFSLRTRGKDHPIQVVYHDLYGRDWPDD